MVTDEAYLYTLILYIEHNPVKANLVDKAWEYPYSSAHIFLSLDTTPQCLKNSWIVQNYHNDTESIKAFLDARVDNGQLAELKKAASLVEVPNSNNEPDWETLRTILQRAENTKERNTLISKAYQEGCSQHGIAKVLGLAQSTVHGIIKRAGKKNTITFT